MSPHRCRLRLEALESRETPGNLTVSFAAATHTLTIVGDSQNNDLKIQTQSIFNDPTVFFLSSATDSINGDVNPLFTPSGVENINIRMLGGNDQVSFESTGQFVVGGSLSVNGGDGANTVMATSLTDLNVSKNLTITNGTNTVGSDSTTLDNLTVGGSLTVRNGNGDSQTVIRRNSLGASFIAGDVTVVNGTGLDVTVLQDTNVNGNLTVRNGRGNASGAAGYTWIVNNFNLDRSYIRGNVSVSYLDGGLSILGDALYDAEVQGNVTWNHGTGSSLTQLDGFHTTLPVIIRGNLTLTGTGPTTLYTGEVAGRTGLFVGKNFSITTGAGSDTLDIRRTEVGGTAKWALGGGDNSVSINDTLFVGGVNLTTGIGADTVNLDTNIGSGGASTFEGAVTMKLGAGNDTVNRVGSTDANQKLVILSTFVIHHGIGSNSMPDPPLGHEFYPFETFIKWIL